MFNWVLRGLRRLLRNGKFTESDIAQQMVEEYKRESDSVAMFVDETQYIPTTQRHVPVSEFYNEYKAFCQSDAYHPLGKKNFLKRIRALGFHVEKKREHVVFAKKRREPVAEQD